LAGSGLKIGQAVEAQVQLVKDYGVIVQIAGESEAGGVQTGFIMNDQKSSHKYKQGQTLSCKVLDIDPVKKIADLSEKLASTKASKGAEKKLKVG